VPPADDLPITERRVYWRWIDDTDGGECSMEEFLADNRDDEFVCESVCALALGESFAGGGGAAPAFEVKRTA
jgi:hypothetical protein